MVANGHFIPTALAFFMTFRIFNVSSYPVCPGFELLSVWSLLKHKEPFHLCLSWTASAPPCPSNLILTFFKPNCKSDYIIILRNSAHQKTPLRSEKARVGEEIGTTLYLTH